MTQSAAHGNIQRFEHSMKMANLMTAVLARLLSFGRACVILVTLLGWFLISNHCALGMFETAKAAAPHATCHAGTGAPSKSPGHDEQSPCCKTLRATLVDLSKPLISFDASTFVLQSYLIGLAGFPEQRDLLRPLELDTGPPFCGSFAESVLQRSILAHAPPVSLS
jgi:hypothetical protein